MKILIIGDGEVGKSAFVNRYVNGKFNEGYRTTVGGKTAVVYCLVEECDCTDPNLTLCVCVCVLVSDCLDQTRQTGLCFTIPEKSLNSICYPM